MVLEERDQVIDAVEPAGLGVMSAYCTPGTVCPDNEPFVKESPTLWMDGAAGVRAN
jgi:hypothetical protein